MNHFYEIARPLIERGLAVIPLRRQTKTPACSWKNFRIWNLDILEKKAGDFADCDVACVSNFGLGRPLFIDFDDESVIPRIETETGKTIPATFKVCSRPKSAPLRQHHIWLQTAYSLKKFKFDEAKNTNVRDVNRVVTSPSGGKMFKTLYDVKGIGGNSYIVGAGSIHQKTGEVYTVVDHSPIAKIPDWVVDWLVRDISRYRSDWRKMNARKMKEKKAAAELPAEKRAELRAQGHPDGWEIYPEDMQDFIMSLMGRLGSFSLSDEKMEEIVAAKVSEMVQGGEQYVTSERGRQSIHNRVTSRNRTNTLALAVTFYQNRKTKPFSDSGTTIPQFDESQRGFGTKRDALRFAIQSFPGQLTVDEAEARLTTAMEDAGFLFDKRKDKNALSDIRREFGFSVTHGEWIRTIRLKETHSPLLHTQVRDGTCPSEVERGRDSECPPESDSGRDSFDKPLVVQEDSDEITGTN
jgi:hypothetical protein